MNIQIFIIVIKYLNLEIFTKYSSICLNPTCTHVCPNIANEICATLPCYARCSTGFTCGRIYCEWYTNTVTLVCLLQGYSKLFTTDQTRINPEYCAIKCVGG